MLVLILLIAMTAANGFICTLVESTLMNVTPAFLRFLRQSDEELASKLQLAHDEYEINQAALAGVNTLLIVFGSALTGVRVAEIYGHGAVPLAAFVTAIAMVGMTQVLPRALANRYWQHLCHFSISVLPALRLFAAPFAGMAEITKIFGLKRYQEPIVRSEIETVAKQGLLDGAIEESEYQLLSNVLQFKQCRLVDIMIAREELTALAPELTIDQAQSIIDKKTNNKFPLFGQTHNETVGYVTRADIAQAIIAGNAKNPVRTLARPILTVPYNMRARKLLTKFRSRNCEIALIVDDYGEVIGMVAQEDVLSALFENIERRVA